MSMFSGRLQGAELEPTTVQVEIAEDRLRISRGRVAVGSWALEKVHAERTSIYRFDLTIDTDKFEFVPDDPTTFSDAIGAVVDLSEPAGRFGLKARIERVAAG